jgi:hypothetical protein
MVGSLPSEVAVIGALVLAGTLTLHFTAPAFHALSWSDGRADSTNPISLTEQVYAELHDIHVCNPWPPCCKDSLVATFILTGLCGQPVVATKTLTTGRVETLYLKVRCEHGVSPWVNQTMRVWNAPGWAGKVME